MGSNSSRSYNVIHKIGKSENPEIFLVEEKSKYYALKKISKSKSNDIKNKEKYIDDLVKISKKFNNKNILEYNRLFDEKNFICILMEYCSDSNLKKFILSYKNKNKFIDENIVKNIILQICGALITIHENDLIHRDLEPDNIFINQKNKIKILLKTNYNKDLKEISNCHYLAPEIYLNQKYNKKIDIYSLGCIIYELLTLNEYYIDNVIKKIERKIDIKIYNAQWQDLIDSLLQIDYNNRPDINYIVDFKNIV